VLDDRHRRRGPGRRSLHQWPACTPDERFRPSGLAARGNEALGLSARAAGARPMTARHINLEDFMARSLRIFMPFLLSSAVRPAEQGTGNATLDGVVFVTGPVAGVVVAAYGLGLDDGAVGSLIAQSPPTDDSGVYHLDLGSYHGTVLLVAHGAGTYLEPAT